MTTVVQTASGTANSTTVSATFGSLPTAGNSVLVKISLTVGTNTIVSVADNQTGSVNTYSSDYSAASGAYSATFFYRVPSVTVNQGTFTVTATAASSGNMAIAIMEVKGLTGAIDQDNSTFPASPGTTVTISNGSANTGINDLVISTINCRVITGASGLTTPPATGYTTWDFADQSTYSGFTASAYKVVGATETSSCTWTWTNSTYVGAAIITYKGSATNPNRGYETINTGTTPGDATGDAARVGGTKINDSLVSVYSALGGRATTPGAFNTASAAGTTTTLIDSTTVWATNQFAGQYVTITTGTLPSSGTATSNIAYSSLIASNTATTLTFAALPFATTSGCGYEISPVVTTAQTDGQATSVGGTSPSTLIDGTKGWATNTWTGYFVTLLGGAFAGQSAPIASNTSNTLTLSTLFATAIAAGTPYVIGSGQIAASQYATAGSTITVNPGTLWLELNGPTTMTVTFPSSPYDTQRLEISTTTAITSFATAGGTVSGAPSTMSANTGIAFRYHLGTTTWYRVQ